MQLCLPCTNLLRDLTYNYSTLQTFERKWDLKVRLDSFDSHEFDFHRVKCNESKTLEIFPTVRIELRLFNLFLWPSPSEAAHIFFALTFETSALMIVGWVPHRCGALRLIFVQNFAVGGSDFCRDFCFRHFYRFQSRFL